MNLEYVNDVRIEINVRTLQCDTLYLFSVSIYVYMEKVNHNIDDNSQNMSRCV